jgi:hypothetical protein
MINYGNIEPKIIIKRDKHNMNYNEESRRFIREKENNYKEREYNLELMFEKIINITEELNGKLNILNDTVNDKFEELDRKISIIETKINIQNEEKTEQIEDLKELIREKLDIDKKDVLKALSYRDYRSILFIFKLYYKNDKDKYPIRLFKVRKYEYYANKKWNQDLYGSHSMEILISNIQDLFIRYNDINNITYDEFIMNQDFITQLDNEKNKKALFKSITDEIKE